jgi:hypothetical protein
MRRCVLGLIFCGACATAPPLQQLSAASASIGAAHEAGADADGQASGYLARARQELGQAKAALDAGDNTGAEGLLLRARADGDAAAAFAREATTRRQADELSRRAEALRRQNQL